MVFFARVVGHFEVADQITPIKIDNFDWDFDIRYVHPISFKFGDQTHGTLLYVYIFLNGWLTRTDGSWSCINIAKNSGHS